MLNEDVHISLVAASFSPATMTGEAQEQVLNADVIMGATRMLEQAKQMRSKMVSDDAIYVKAYKPLAVSRELKQVSGNVVILVSGDLGLFSAATLLRGVLKDYEVDEYPGISSLVKLCSEVGVPWQHAAIISNHGVKTNVVDGVRRYRLTFILTGGNVKKIVSDMCFFGFGDLNVHVGSNLGMDDQCIESTTFAALLGREDFPSLTSLLVENDKADPRVVGGISDEEFERGSVPMTKSVVRAVVSSRLHIAPGEVCYDIGCGTGSVSVEMALAAYEGRVFAWDKNAEAVGLTQKNAQAFHVSNITAECGMVPQCIEGAPKPDVVFIGGTSGSMAEIIERMYALNEDVRFGVTAIVLENALSAVAKLESLGCNVNMEQIQSAHSRNIGDKHMMLADNPIYIITTGDKAKCE